jgi:hypothetical protein
VRRFLKCFAIVAFGAVAMTSFWFIAHHVRSKSESSQAVGPTSRLGVVHGRDRVNGFLPKSDSPSGPAVPDSPGSHAISTIFISPAPTAYLSQKTRAEADFGVEPVDNAWSSRQWNEIKGSLALMEEVVSSAQIDCRSSTCRVELRWRDPYSLAKYDSRDKHIQRIGVWQNEVMKRSGFLQGNTEFLADQFTSLSYFTVKPVPKQPELPPEFPPEAAEIFMRARAEQLRKAAEAGVASSAGAWTFDIPVKKRQ